MAQDFADALKVQQIAGLLFSLSKIKNDNDNNIIK